MNYNKNVQRTFILSCNRINPNNLLLNFDCHG